MLRSSVDGGWKVRVSLGCNMLVKDALGLHFELVRRLLFFGLDGIAGSLYLGAGRVNLGAKMIKQRHELSLTLIISKDKEEKGAPSILFSRFAFSTTFLSIGLKIPQLACIYNPAKELRTKPIHVYLF